MKTYIVQIKGRAYGPLDLPKLQALAQKGRLNKDSLVKVDAGSWQAASTIPEIFSSSKTSGKKSSVQLDFTDLNPKAEDGLSSLLGNGLPDFEPPDFSTKALEQKLSHAWQQPISHHQPVNQSLPSENTQVTPLRQSDETALRKYLERRDMLTDVDSTDYMKLAAARDRNVIIVICMILVICMFLVVALWPLTYKNFSEFLQNSTRNEQKTPINRPVQDDHF